MLSFLNVEGGLLMGIRHRQRVSTFRLSVAFRVALFFLFFLPHVRFNALHVPLMLQFIVIYNFAGRFLDFTFNTFGHVLRCTH